MPTPREIIAANTRASLANLASGDLEYSSDQGGTWTAWPAATAAVLHVDRPTPALWDDRAQAELAAQTAVLKVSDQVTPMPDQGWWIRQTGVTDRAWAIEGPATVHSGQRQFPCKARYLAAGAQAGRSRRR